jgi:hypothetical protein
MFASAHYAKTRERMNWLSATHAVQIAHICGTKYKVSAEVGFVVSLGIRSPGQGVNGKCRSIDQVESIRNKIFSHSLIGQE